MFSHAAPAEVVMVAAHSSVSGISTRSLVKDEDDDDEEEEAALDGQGDVCHLEQCWRQERVI